jgi:tRNA U34 5-methylaminomethyl-2-thiouridine-forming methyltransferase MnmC
MHSTIGPGSESELIFLRPSRIRERLTESTSKPFVLWDVGMGIAGNSAPVWEFIQSADVRRPVKIHSFEKYPEALAQALEEIDLFPFLARHQEDLHALLDSGHCRSNRHGIEHHWTLHTGDFESRLKDGSAGVKTADLIFWDFYSPKVCPELWSLELFQLVHDTAPRSILLTYSAATPVRAALLLSGFVVGLPFVGDRATPIKAESTMAAADTREAGAIPRLLDRSWLEKLSRSTQFRPYGKSHWATRATYDEIAAAMRQNVQFRQS